MFWLWIQKKTPRTYSAIFSFKQLLEYVSVKNKAKHHSFVGKKVSEVIIKLFEQIHSLLRSLTIASQLSKHSPHGTQFGSSPVVPRSHLSHFLPVIPSTQGHCPLTGSHWRASEPSGLHSHSGRGNNVIVYYVCWCVVYFSIPYPGECMEIHIKRHQKIFFRRSVLKSNQLFSHECW